MPYSLKLKTKHKFLYSLIVFIFISCGTENNYVVDLNRFLPENSDYILQTSNLSLFISGLDSLEIIKNNPDLLAGDLKNHIRDLSQYITPGASLVSFGKMETGESNFVFIGREQPPFFNIDSVKNRSLETLKYDNYTIHKYELEKFTTYSSFIDGVLLASNSLEQLKESLNQSSGPLESTLARALSGADPDKASIFVNHKTLDDLYKTIFSNGIVPLTSLAKWSVVDLSMEQEKLVLNGISLGTAGPGSLLQVFSNAGIQTNEMARVTPVTSAGFYSFTYNDLNILLDNLNEYDSSGRQLDSNTIFEHVGEAGVIFGRNEHFVALRTIEPESVKEITAPQSELIKELRGVAIYALKNSTEIFSVVKPLLPLEEKNYYTWLEEFMIFGNTPEALESLISAYLNNPSLGDQEYYNQAMENLAGASSFLMVANSKELISTLSDAATPDFLEDIKNLNFEGSPLMAFQFVQEKDFAHIHATISSGENTSSHSVNHITAIATGSKPATPVYVVRNLLGNTGEITFQDEDNKLFLFAASGEKLWEKQLDSRIIGGIHQVDLYKNNNLYLAFTTLNALHIIDRNSNPAKPFPITLKADVTKPLSIFDYDNNSTYRFVVTQSNKVQMFDSRGKIVRGFDFQDSPSPITQAPKHIRMGNKDYIVFPEENGKLNILSRQGKSRVDVKDKIIFSDNEWYDYQNTFVSASGEAGLITITEAGNIKETAGTGNLTIAAQNNLLVKLEENILTINKTVVNLDYGLYTSPQIFNVNGKVYIGFTDTQANRVYVFDQNATLLPGFPIYGSSGIQIGRSQGNKAYLAVPGVEEEVNIYEF